MIPSIALIAAVATNGVIGRDGALPWRIPADLKHFKALTLGKPVIMGRKTYVSIGRPLPGRQNIVLTRDAGFRAEGVTVARNLDAALAAANRDAAEVMVIGGAAVYAAALPHARRLYLTLVRASVAGDVRFPDFDRADWVEVSHERRRQDQPVPLDFSFLMLERRPAR